jgi:hypothetical protein
MWNIQIAMLVFENGSRGRKDIAFKARLIKRHLLERPQDQDMLAGLDNEERALIERLLSGCVSSSPRLEKDIDRYPEKFVEMSISLSKIPCRWV